MSASSDTALAERFDRVLSLVHTGDLHITDTKQRNVLDFLSIVAQIEIECARLVDFAALPGASRSTTPLHLSS